MGCIGWGGNTLSGFAAGLVLLGLIVLPITGCSQSVSQPPSDETTASALPGSMKVQGTVPAELSTGVAAVVDAPPEPAGTDAQAAAPGVVSVAAVLTPMVPAVTSPTTPALALTTPINPPAVSPPSLGRAHPAAAVVASTGTPVLSGLDGGGMQGAAQTLNPVMMHALKQFQIASAAFPDFCRDWGRKLSVREHDNLGHIKWTKHDGVETGSYVGYGTIDSCTCKEAANGVAVGILTYKEFDYTLTGKNIDEARRATPHAASVVPTREIFAYDKGKWFW